MVGKYEGIRGFESPSKSKSTNKSIEERLLLLMTLQDAFLIPMFVQDVFISLNESEIEYRDP